MRSPISCAAWQRDRPVRKAAGRARSPEPQHLFISGRLIGRSLSFQPHPWLGPPRGQLRLPEEDPLRIAFS